jgi:hypothetical protein
MQTIGRRVVDAPPRRQRRPIAGRNDEFLRRGSVRACAETPALAARHGLGTIWNGALYRESVAAGCWIATLAQLQEVALVGEREVAGHIGAVITDVWKPAAREIRPGAEIDPARGHRSRLGIR